MKLYLDDERTTPEGWFRVYTAQEAIDVLKMGLVEEISLDHDLGNKVPGSGYDVLLFIEEQVFLWGVRPPIIYIHTANPSARIKMESGKRAIEKRWNNR